MLAFALALRDPAPGPGGRWSRLRLLLPYLALAGGVFFSYSFAGLAWPIAIVVLWGLTQPGVRRALAPRALARALWRPRTLVVLLVLAGLGVLRADRALRLRRRLQQGRRQQHLRAGLAGRGVRRLARLQLPARRRRGRPPLRPRRGDRRPGGGRSAPPGGCGGASSPCRSRSPPASLLYLVSLPFSGDYSQAKALMIGAPLAMLIAIRPLLAGLGPPPACPLLRAGLGGAGGRLRRRLALLDLPGPARRAGRAARARLGAERLPADRPRPAGPLRGPGPLRRLRAARRRHPRAAGRVPRRGRRRRTSRSPSTPATPTARSTSTPSRARP